MKKSVKQKLEVDLTKPLNIEDVTVESDCFSKEYDPITSECQVCAVHEVCAILKTEAVKSMGSKIIKKGNSFIDEWDFEAIPKSKILALIKANPKQYATADILEVIKDKTKCDDETTLVMWLKNFILDNNLGTTENGKIYSKDV